MDMKRMLTGSGFWVASCIGCAAILMSVTWPEEWKVLESGTFLMLWQGALPSKLVVYVLPACGVLPYADSYLQEWQTGFLRSYINRINRREYIRGKIISMTLAGFLAWTAAALMAGLILFFLIYPHEIQSNIWGGTAAEMAARSMGISAGAEVTAMEVLVSTYTEIFWNLAIIIVRIGLIVGILGNLSAVCAQLCRSTYMAYGLPFVVYYMLIILKERYFDKLYYIYPAEWVDPGNNWGGPSCWGLWVLLLLTNMGVAMLNGAMIARRLEEI